MKVIECCYCMNTERCEDPPTLHKCSRCGRDFRVYWNYARTSKIELTKEALEHFAKKETVA